MGFIVTWVHAFTAMAQVSLNEVRVGTNFIKWGKAEEILLNEVITVTNDKLRGKKWNLLLILIPK
jgi:hypothetical protein